MIFRDVLQLVLWVVLGFAGSWVIFYQYVRLDNLPKDQKAGIFSHVSKTAMVCAILWTGLWISAATFNLLQLLGELT